MTSRLATLVMTTLVAVSTAMSQSPPDRQPDSAPPKDRPSAQPLDRAEYRARLERSVVDSKRRLERFEAAIRKLDEGASVDDVRRDAEAPGPPGMRGGGEGRPGRPRGEEGRRGPDGPPPGEKLTREELIAFIETSNAAFAAKIRTGLKDNPASTGRLLDRMEPMVREIKAERDPQMRELRVQNLTLGFELLGATRAFADAYRADADSPATAEATAKLRGMLASHFDVRTKMHQQEIIMLERRIVQLREELDRQLKNRESFIDRRLEDIKRFNRQRMKSGENRGDHKPDPQPPAGG